MNVEKSAKMAMVFTNAEIGYEVVGLFHCPTFRNHIPDSSHWLRITFSVSCIGVAQDLCRSYASTQIFALT